MAIEASHNAFVNASPIPATNFAIVAPTIIWLMRSVIFVLYALLFLVTLMTVGFIEIRQANMVTFDSLIATLEQRDAYNTIPSPFEPLLSKVRLERAEYKKLIADLDCPNQIDATKPQQNGPDKPSVVREDAGPEAAKMCAKLRGDIENHFYALSGTEDGMLAKIANLGPYYLQYTDGITQQAPQIIPTLPLLNSPLDWVRAWARSPFEIMVMFLLVCMGALGGVINVTRCFVEKSLDNPPIPDLIYKPAMGAVVALGIYILFRASQLFIAGQSQTGGVASTSIFLVAGLGLASGVCASDAIGQIEALAKRMLRRSSDDREDNKPAADPPSPATPAGGDAIPTGPAPSAS
jgi:hypothetical protein